MSTIKVNSIKNTSTNDGGISIDNSGDVQMSGSVKISGQQMPSEGPLSHRNICENGAMRIAQRGNSTTGFTASGATNVDRMSITLASLGTWTTTCESDGPPGFVRSLKFNCTTAAAVPPSGSYLLCSHRIESVNLQPLEYGTSNAKDITISFWVKSNKTGNASFEILQLNNSNKMYVTSYEIEEEDTWEYKTITIPGDPSGVIADDTSAGFALGWWLNSDNATFAGGNNQETWVAFDNTSRNPSSSNLGVGGAVNDYWQITGLQIEIGSKATPFEHQNYGDYLFRCQRYFYKANQNLYGGRYSSSHIMIIHEFPVTMRNIPVTTGSYSFATGGSLSTNYTGVSSFQQYAINTTVGAIVNAEFSAEF